METHEIADIFPLLPDSELQEMADDIGKEGLRVPIITYQGKILDGRNREKACAIAGVTPLYQEYSEDDPIGFVISMNMKRRHLTVSQRAAIASELATATVGNPTFGLKSEKDNSVKLPNSVHTIEQTAKLMNVSPKSVGIARSILKNRPDLAKEVKAGTLSLSAAKERLKGTPY